MELSLSFRMAFFSPSYYSVVAFVFSSLYRLPELLMHSTLNFYFCSFILCTASTGVPQDLRFEHSRLHVKYHPLGPFGYLVRNMAVCALQIALVDISCWISIQLWCEYSLTSILVLPFVLCCACRIDSPFNVSLRNTRSKMMTWNVYEKKRSLPSSSSCLLYTSWMIRWIG